VTVIGLGIMGSALSRNLMAAGYTVSGFDPDSTVSEKAASSGVEIAESPVQAAHGSDIILTSLPSDSALTSTVEALTTRGAESETKPIVAELSTLSLESKTEARDRLAASGIEMLDCPISGTGAQAKSRDIVLYASGGKAAFERCQPVFEAIARQSFFLGDFGNGMRMKFIANLLVAVHNVASAEAINLGTLAGLEPQLIYDVISAGAGTSRIFELRGPMMVRENYEPATMKLGVWEKDMTLIRNFANALDAKTPLFTATEPLYQNALESGLAEQDTAAVHTLFRAR
jgi:putative dehydrogenase